MVSWSQNKQPILLSRDFSLRKSSWICFRKGGTILSLEVKFKNRSPQLLDAKSKFEQQNRCFDIVMTAAMGIFCWYYPQFV